jgi:hypothetical protein
MNFKNPAFLLSAAFAAVAGVALAFQDEARIAKPLSQSLAGTTLLLSLFWNQREIYTTEKRLAPDKKLVDHLPKLQAGLWLSGAVMAAAYAFTRAALR